LIVIEKESMEWSPIPSQQVDVHDTTSAFFSVNIEKISFYLYI
jgi:hypothetical protein